MLNFTSSFNYNNYYLNSRLSSSKCLPFKGSVPANIKPEDIDYMTKLKNKKCLLETLETLKKNDKNFSIAMLDMDNFKSINELFGYKTGDEFIILFTENESEEKQTETMNTLLANINKKLDSHKAKDIYEKTAQKRIDILTQSDDKIKKLQKDKYGKEILMDLKQNCKTKEAQNDEYLFSKLNSFSESITFAYTDLLNECIKN